MTCKDCLHYEACKGTYNATWTYSEPNDFDNEHYTDVDDCPNFTTRSEWTHFPCKVGDMVYKVSFVHKNITPLKVEGFICNLTLWKVRCTHLIPSWIGNQKEHIYISFSSFDKNTFLTCEEAEKALERLKVGRDVK